MLICVDEVLFEMKKSCESEYIRLKKKISDLKNKMHISHSRSQFKKLQDELTLVENKLKEYRKGVIVVEETKEKKLKIMKKCLTNTNKCDILYMHKAD